MKLPGALSQLNEEQHQFLISLLSLGKNDGEITDALQVEKGWLTTVKRATLLKNVNRWRKGTGQEAVLKSVTDHMVNPDGTMKRHVDALEAMYEMYDVQAARVKKMREKEEPTPMLLKQVTEELKIQFTMAKEIIQAELACGVRRRVRPGEVITDYQDDQTIDGEFTEVFSESDRKMLEIIRQEVAGHA